MKNLIFAVLFLGLTAASGAGAVQQIMVCNMRGFSVGDVNGDGLPDIAICSPDGANLFFQQKNRRFNAVPDRVLKMKDAFDVTISDFDGDGRNDVACADYHPNLYVFFFRRNFELPLIHACIDQWRPELVCGQLTPGNHVDLLGNWVWRRLMPDGTVYETTILPPKGEAHGNRNPLVCDIDLDGNKDVILIFENGPRVYCGPLSIQKEHVFVRPADLAMFYSIPLADAMSYNYLVADADGDGTPDILYSSASTVGVKYFPQDRFSGFSKTAPRMLLSRTGGYLLYGNFDKTGRKKLAVLSPVDIAIYNLPGKAPESVVKTNLRDEIIRVKSGDVNGDGKAEFLISTKNGLMIF